MAKKLPRGRHRNTRGFALIVLAVILAVAGILMINLMTSPPDKELRQTIATKNKKIDRVRDAFIVYYNQNNAFPCPASRTLPATDTKFGKDYAMADGGTTCNAPCTAGSPVSAVNGAAGAGVQCATDYSASVPVKIGAVPTRSLGLSDEYGLDEWGNRLTYAVDTGGGTNVTLYKADGVTKVPVTDINLAPGTAGAVSFVVASHGKDGLGAYTKSGTLNAAQCPSPATKIEGENCNNDSIFVQDTKQVIGATVTYDDFTNYVAVPGCDATTNKCYVGVKMYGAGTFQTFRFDKKGTMRILNKLSGGATPWGVNITQLASGYTPYNVDCQFLSNTGYTGCFMIGSDGINGKALAFKIKPNSGIDAATYTPASTASGYTYLGCGPVSGTKMLCIVGKDQSSYVPLYQIYRIDFSTGVGTGISMTPLNVQQTGNMVTGWGASCAKAKNIDEAVCVIAASSGSGYTKANTYRIENVVSGNAIGAGGTEVKITEYDGVATAFKTGLTATDNSRTPPNQISWSSGIRDFTCNGIDRAVLCVGTWTVTYGYSNPATGGSATVGVFRWKPNVSTNTNGASDFVMVDAAQYYGVPSSAAVGHTECSESTAVSQTDKFVCTLRFALDSKFSLFSLQNCNDPVISTPTDTSGQATSCFVGTTTRDMSSATYNLFNNTRTFDMVDSSGVTSYAGNDATFGNGASYLVCTPQATPNAEQFCLASGAKYNAKAPFHLWKLLNGATVQTSSVTSSSLTGASGSLICDATVPAASQCDTAYTTPYYEWNATGYDTISGATNQLIVGYAGGAFGQLRIAKEYRP